MRSNCTVTTRILTVVALVLLSACGTPPKAPLEDRMQSSRPSGGSYRIRSGDTLYSVAFRAGVDYRELASWNSIKPPYTIYPGQVLRLSPPRSTRPSSTRASSSQSRTSPSTSSSSSSSRNTAPPAKSSTVPPKQASSSSTAQSGSRNSAKAASVLGWIWPAQGSLASRFVSGDETRNGIKISGAVGQAVLAAEAGEVVYAGSGLIGYGRLIIIQHNDNYLSAYGHNNRLLVREGQKVAKGERIAEMGKNNADTPMLHFEIRRDGKPVDPLRYLPRL